MHQTNLLAFQRVIFLANQCDREREMTVDVLEEGTYVIVILVGSLRLIEQTEWSDLEKRVNGGERRNSAVPFGLLAFSIAHISPADCRLGI